MPVLLNKSKNLWSGRYRGARVHMWSGRFCRARAHIMAARWQHFFATKNGWGRPTWGPRWKIKTWGLKYWPSVSWYQKSSKSVQPFSQKAVTCPFFPFILIILTSRIARAPHGNFYRQELIPWGLILWERWPCRRDDPKEGQIPRNGWSHGRADPVRGLIPWEGWSSFKAGTVGELIPWEGW